jgi:hypothetical protein
MMLKAFGCSFIYGTELADVGDPFSPSRPPASKNTWTALIAKKLALSYKCAAKGGCGNLLILDRVLDNIEMDRDQQDFYIVAWTYGMRFDYSNRVGPHFNGPELDCWRTLRPMDLSNLHDFYFEKLQSDHRDKLTTLLYMSQAIDALQSRNLPFYMTCMDDEIFNEKWHSTPGMQYLQKKVQPHIRTFEGQNFLRWARARGFPVGDGGHPLEEAHAAAADLVYPEIVGLVNTMNKRD